jgi:hypothetical protein
MICGVCGKWESIRECERCNTDICIDCMKVVTIPRLNQMVGGVITSSMHPANKRIYVCPHCFATEEFLDV